MACTQIGFATKGPKLLVTDDLGPANFQIENMAGDVRFASSLDDPRTWSADERTCRSADFSSFEEDGEFVLTIPQYGVQHKIKILPSPWGDLGKALLKAFYFQRASIEIMPEFAGVYARSLGHPDTHVLIHSSAASESRPEGFVISSPKGWYDAGDYNKYIVNSGITVWTLLTLFECFPDFCRRMDLNIPESGAGIPDLLSEVKWNLDWMLSMQDPADGGVYHKLTNLRFDGMVMPSKCENPRYVVMKTTAASFHFAAVMAQASRVYRNELPEFSAQCLLQAKDAFQWGIQNPNIPYRQPEDIRTGRYEDEYLEDEQQWAAFELFIVTGDEAFEKLARIPSSVNYGIPVWQRVGVLGQISLALGKNDLAAKSSVLKIADELLERQRENAYRNSMKVADFVWGSNGMATNQGLILVIAYLLTGNKEYSSGAVHMMDYILGRNPLNQSFVTGFGEQSPKYPHHRLSEADGVPEPIPGFIVGGANFGKQDAYNCPPYLGDSPALAYLDYLGSFASNEVAINWNAPAAFLAVGLQALFSSQ